MERGILSSSESPSSFHVFSREIVDLKNYIKHPLASKFIDLRFDDTNRAFEIDPTSFSLLRDLKQRKLATHLPADNRHNFSILWRFEEGVSVREHESYIHSLLTRFKVNMTDLIDRFARQQVEVNLPPIIDEIVQHWLVVRNRTRNFIGREDLLEVVQSYVTSYDTQPLVLFGESGSGKTATMSRAASLVGTREVTLYFACKLVFHRMNSFQTRQWVSGDCLVVARFIGSTVESFDTRQLLYNICQQIAIFLQQPRDVIPNEYKDLQQHFFEAVDSFPEEKTLVLYIDSLNMLVPQFNAHYLYWIPKVLRENVKVIVSTLPETHGLLARLRNEVVQSENNFIEIPPLPIDSCVQLLQEQLQVLSRCLHEDQLAQVRECFSECSYPLYVDLMLNEVKGWSSSFEPSHLPTNMTDFTHHFLSKLELKHGRVFASRAAAYLTASTTGLSDCEMEDVLSLDDDVINEYFTHAQRWSKVRRLPSIKWIRYKNDISSFLVTKETECVKVSYWSHPMFVDVIKKRYLHDEQVRAQVHSALADYNLGVWFEKKKPFKCIINGASFGGNERYLHTGTALRYVASQPLTFVGDGDVTRYNKRKYEQVPRHLYLAGRLDELNSLVLFNYNFLYNKTKALSLEHILADFVLNPGVEATLVERALRDAQPFMEVNIDNMPAELTGRLLCYYTTHPNIRKLIQECDTAGLSQCALIPNFPYHQVPGSPLRYTIECQNKPTNLCLHGDDSRHVLVKNPDEKLVRVFDLATGEHARDISMTIGEMTLTPNGLYAIVEDHVQHKSIKIHSVEDGRYLGQLLPTAFLQLRAEESFRISKLSVSDSFLCFTVTTIGGKSERVGSTLCVADVEFCKFIDKIQLSAKSSVCEVTPDSRYVVCNSAETLLVFDLCTLEETSSTPLSYRPSKLVFTQDATKAFHGNNFERKVHGIILKNGTIEVTFKIPCEDQLKDDTIQDLIVSQNQDMLLIVAHNHLLVYSISTEKITSHFERPDDVPVEFKLPRSHYRNITFSLAAFSPDNKFVIASIFRNVYIWNLSNNKLLTSLQAPVGIIHNMLVPRDRGQIVTRLERTCTLHVWSLGDAIGHVGMLDRLTSQVTLMRFSKDGKLGFIGCADSDEIGVLDMTSGTLIDLLTHESTVTDFNVTPDGKYLMTSLIDAKQGAFNKIWHVESRRVIYEFGHVAARIIPMTSQNSMLTLMQDADKFKLPFRISQLNFKDAAFEQFQCDALLPFIVSDAFVTPKDRYLVVLSAEDYDETRAHYVNPTICAVALQSNVDIARYTARDLHEITCMRRILHVRPYANSEYSVIVVYTNEPDIADDDDERKSRGYDFAFGLLIFDVAAGVAVQVIEDFVPPKTPIDQLIFNRDARFCIDHESNVFEMANGFYTRQLLRDSKVHPRLLALQDRVLVYFDKCYLFVIRVRDGKCIGNVNVHGQISAVGVAYDERTLVVGCEDGALLSYVIIEEAVENAEQVLESVYTRQAKLVSTRESVKSARGRTWDKVDVKDMLNGPPYSRPPSAIISGPRDRDLLKRVTPITRPQSTSSAFRPRSSDPSLHIQRHTSRACSLM